MLIRRSVLPAVVVVSDSTHHVGSRQRLSTGDSQLVLDLIVKYEAHVTEQEGRWWAVEIPELGENAQTQARRLAEVEGEARDYIAVTLDVAPSSVQVRVCGIRRCPSGRFRR